MKTVSKKMLALVAVSGLVVAGYATAASEGLLPGSVDMGMGLQKRCQRGDAAGSAENAELERCKARTKAQRHPGRPHPAPFAIEGSTVSGKWVSFQVEDGAIVGYTSKGPFADAVIFDRIEGPGSDEDGMVARGPLWVAKEGDLGAAAFNAPNAFLAVRNRGTEAAVLTYHLAEGIVASEEERGIVLAHEGHRGLLKAAGNGTLALSEGVVTATLGPGDGVVFAIEGFPRLLALELKVLRHLAQQRGGQPAPGSDAVAEAEVVAEVA